MDVTKKRTGYVYCYVGGLASVDGHTEIYGSSQPSVKSDGSKLKHSPVEAINQLLMQ